MKFITDFTVKEPTNKFVLGSFYKCLGWTWLPIARYAMTEMKTNRQRRIAKNERDEKAWLNIRAKSYDERRDMAAALAAPLLVLYGQDLRAIEQWALSV